MKVPAAITQQVSQHYSPGKWCVITLNKNNQITDCNSAAQTLIEISDKHVDVFAALPLLASESLNEPFFIPFYNHQDQVFDVHFFLDGDLKYLLLVPVDQHHLQVQKKQQQSHDNSIQNKKLTALFNTLEAAQEELKAANSAKSFYISALSHEIGNPLNVIKGYNELLQEGSIEIETATQIISRNVNKLERIISQSIDFDREQTKKFSTLIKPANLIDDQLKDFIIDANNKNLKLLNQVDTEILLASNRTKWNQIFTNLISNAIKYTETGSITVSSVTADQMLHIDVTDTGCGMSQEFQQELFTAWNRELKSASSGHGIGLVISKMLAEQINAKLTLRSSGSDGSCFRLSIPYTPAQRSLRVLLVDDDPDCLALFKHHLTQAGHHVLTADSISHLKRQFSAHRFDVLVTDLNLTDGQSHQVYPEIKALVDKVIIMSAGLTTEMRNEIEALGVDQILCKPLTQDQLVNSITLQD